ncbi:hypothetical protein VPH35_014363 [Triticum aestivum]
MEDASMEFLHDAVERFPLREEFADNFEHPDPIPLVFLADDVAGHVVLAESNTGSGCAKKVGDNGTRRAREGVRRRHDAFPTRSAQSTSAWLDKKAAVRQCATKPGTVSFSDERSGAVDPQVCRGADKSVVRPELGLSFDSLGEARDFYNLYSWEISFGIWYGKSRLNAERTKVRKKQTKCAYSWGYTSEIG